MRIWPVLAAMLVTMQAAAVLADSAHDPLSGAPLPPGQQRGATSPISDRFYVIGSFYDPAVSTSLRIDGQSPAAGMPGRTGTVVSGEKDMGLAGRLQQPRIELMFRLKKRNRLRLNYFETSRHGDRLLSRPVFFGDLDFDVGDRVTSYLDFRSFDLTYTYSFLRTEHFELGTGLAAHFIEAVGHGAVAARNERKDISGSGVFPTVPLDFTWVISRHFAFTTRAQYFKASVSGFTGALGQYHGDLQYRWKPNFTLGAGYTRMKWSLDVNDANFPGIFRLDVRGPEAFFKVSF